MAEDQGRVKATVHTLRTFFSLFFFNECKPENLIKSNHRPPRQAVLFPLSLAERESLTATLIIFINHKSNFLT